MSNVKDIISIIKSSFEENANPHNAKAMEAYMKGQFKLYGIKAPLRKSILKPIYPEVKRLERKEFLVLIERLWSAEQRDYQYAAMEFLQKNKKKLTAEDVGFIESLITRKSWWDSVDMLASHMVGHLFKNDLALRDEWIERWMQSGNMWLQRTCLIFQLKYAQQQDFDLMKALILELKPINEFFIQKAIGWSLRQYARFNPVAVQEFVEENVDLSNLAKREALKHFF